MSTHVDLDTPTINFSLSLLMFVRVCVCVCVFCRNYCVFRPRTYQRSARTRSKDSSIGSTLAIARQRDRQWRACSTYLLVSSPVQLDSCVRNEKFVACGTLKRHYASQASSHKIVLHSFYCAIRCETKQICIHVNFSRGLFD